MTPIRSLSGLTRNCLVGLSLTISLTISPSAHAVQPLDDSSLSEVRGRDGVSFAVNVNANIGSVQIGTTDSAGNAASLNLNNVLATGTVTTTVDLTAGTSGTASYINWAFPDIVTTKPFQFGFDLLVTANGSSFGTGVQFQNISLSGSSFQMTPSVNTGITFGMGIETQVGSVLLQPNGRGNTTGQMSVTGISIGAAGSNGTAPWIVADINAQPGIINIVSDANGNPNLQFGIGWPTAGGSAPSSGSLQVNNITFTTPGGDVNLGSSSIGSIQVQYLNVRLKTGS